MGKNDCEKRFLGENDDEKRLEKRLLGDGSGGGGCFFVKHVDVISRGFITLKYNNLGNIMTVGVIVLVKEVAIWGC